MSADRFAAFRNAHHGPRPLILPNAWDHASAAALVAAGFTVIGTTSLGVAAAHGLADGTGAAREQTVALAERLARLPAMITVDVEGGFSDDPEEVAGLAETLAAMGIAGINIEDGRPGGLAQPGEQAARIGAVKDRCPDLFVNARTDAYWLGLQDPLEQSLARAERYLDAGADGIFVPGALPREEIEVFKSVVDAPLNLLYLPGGLSADELGGLGVERVSTGSLLFRTALGTAVGTATAVREGKPFEAVGPSYAEVQSLVATSGDGGGLQWADE